MNILIRRLQSQESYTAYLIQRMGYLILLSRISRTQVFRVRFLRSTRERKTVSISQTLADRYSSSRTSANAWPAILRPVRAVSHSRWNRKLVVTSLLLFIRTSNIQMTLATELSARTIVRGILSRPHRPDNAFAFTLGIYLRNNRWIDTSQEGAIDVSLTVLGTGEQVEENYIGFRCIYMSGDESIF